MNARLDELIAALGYADALKLMRCFGGVRIYVPNLKRIRPASLLAREVGIEIVRKLAAVWPQLELAIPRNAEGLRCIRDREIRRESSAATLREQARKYGLTERQILNIRAEPDAETLQR